MKLLFLPMTLSLLIASTTAFAAKPCDELIAEITAKLEAKHVENYKLEAVLADATAEGTVVGTCEGGTKKVMYTRK